MAEFREGKALPTGRRRGRHRKHLRRGAGRVNLGGAEETDKRAFIFSRMAGIDRINDDPHAKRTRL